jgi:hypothetical protein
MPILTNGRGERPFKGTAFVGANGSGEVTATEQR